MKLDIQIQENTSSKLPGAMTVRLAGSLDTATSLRVRTALIGALMPRQSGLRSRRRLF